MTFHAWPWMIARNSITPMCSTYGFFTNWGNTANAATAAAKRRSGRMETPRGEERSMGGPYTRDLPSSPEGRNRRRARKSTYTTSSFSPEAT
jgi:hypothetical protein